MAIFATTAVSAIFVAPNTVQLLAYVQKYVGPQPRLQERLYQTLARLRKKGLVRADNRLSRKGKARAGAFARLELIAPKAPLRWDRKWRIVMFDIWERRRKERDRVRSLLAGFGFEQLQHSVWVHPYPCEELFVYLKSELRLGRGIRYVIAYEIDEDVALRKRFDLPLS